MQPDKGSGMNLVMKLAAIFFFLISTAAAAPNILVIVTDDHRLDQIDPFMPTVRNEIFNKGVEFSRAYVTTPACCPSRSSIFTGLYAKNHGVLTNRGDLKLPTIFKYLKDDYYQGIIGKYLNTWNGEPRPEFDYWVAFDKGSTRYLNPRLNINGTWSDVPGYITNIFTVHALKFLEHAREQSKPFFLTLTYNAPHDSATPDPDVEREFDNMPFSFPLAFNRSYHGQVSWLRDYPKRKDIQIQKIMERTRDRWECLGSVDRSIMNVLSSLEQNNQLANTIIFFISDNGLFNGEHKLTQKDSPYEPAVHVPFAIRYDAIISTPRKSDSIVANIDIAPTIFDVLSKPAPRRFDGLSLKNLLSTETPVRDHLFLEGYRDAGLKRKFRALVEKKYKFIEYWPYDGNSRNWELYDLDQDSGETKNLVRVPTFRETVTKFNKKILDFYSEN